MKKFLILVVLVVIALQAYTNYKVSKALDEAELNALIEGSFSEFKANVKGFLNGKELEKMEQILENSDIKVSAVSKEMGLFSSQARIEVDVHKMPVAINADISHVLGSVSASGNIEPAQKELLEVFEKFFGKPKPLTYSYDGALSLNLADFKIKGNKEELSFEPSSLKLDFDKNFAQIDIAGFSYSSRNSTFSLKNLMTNVTLFDVDASFKNYKSKGFASFDELVFDMKKEKFYLSFNSFSTQDDTKVKDGSLSSNVKTNTAKTIFKSPLSAFELDDLQAKINYKNIQMGDIKNPEDILSKDSAIAFDELSFKLNGANVSSKLDLNLKENYTKANFKSLLDFLVLSGEFSSDKALSTALNLPLLGIFEQGAIEGGYLLKNNDGYKTSFEGSALNLTFNGKTKLDLSKELRLR